MKVCHDFPEFWFNLASSHPTQYKKQSRTQKESVITGMCDPPAEDTRQFQELLHSFSGSLGWAWGNRAGGGRGDNIGNEVGKTKKKLILFSRHHHLKFNGPSFLLSSPDRTSFFKPSFPSSFRQVDLEAIDIFGCFSTQWSGWRKPTQMIPSMPA